MSCLSKEVAHCRHSLVHFISQIPKEKMWAVGNSLNAKPRTEGACCSISFQKILRSNFWKNCQNKKKGNLVCGCSHIITSSKFGGFQTPPPPSSALVSICLTPPPPIVSICLNGHVVKVVRYLGLCKISWFETNCKIYWFETKCEIYWFETKCKTPKSNKLNVNFCSSGCT